MLDIEVLDHVVIGQQRFVSLKERGPGVQQLTIGYCSPNSSTSATEERYEWPDA